MKNSKLFTILIPLALATGCTVSAAGEWESTERVGNDRHELSLEENGRGEGQLSFFFEGDQFLAEYDIDWFEDDGRVEIDLECKGDCGLLDTTLDCELDDDGETMRCDGDGLFADFDFEFRRR